MKKLTNRQKQAIETKLKITEKATELFKKKGFELVTIKDICEATGISIGAFYHHFQSKSEIINTGHKQIDMLVIEKIHTLTFESSLDRIRGTLKEAGHILEGLGWHFVSDAYKTLLGTQNKYTLSVDRLIYAEFKNDVAHAVSRGELVESLDVDGMVETMLRTFRGVIFDWCLHEGRYPLNALLIEDFNRIVLAYQPERRA